MLLSRARDGCSFPQRMLAELVLPEFKVVTVGSSLDVCDENATKRADTTEGVY